MITTIKAPSRSSHEYEVPVLLDGLDAESLAGKLSFEIDVPGEQERAIVQQAVTAQLLTPALEPPGIARFKLLFEPNRPFRLSFDLVVTKEGGGRWRFEIALEATEPEIDDTIVVEGTLGIPSNVSFRLSNNVAQATPFEAFFTSESPTQLAIHPAQGWLEPAGGDGTVFVITFTPQEYGKVVTGKLVIQTSSMQWTYVVKGTHPKYEPPKPDAKVSTFLSPEVLIRRQFGFVCDAAVCTLHCSCALASCATRWSAVRADKPADEEETAREFLEGQSQARAKVKPPNQVTGSTKATASR